MAIRFSIFIILFILLGLVEAKTPSPQIKEIQSPAAENSGEPNLFTGEDGSVFLSWVEGTKETGFALRFSRLEDEHWSSPELVAEGRNWFVNWADFPSLVSHKNGLLAAHWLAKSGQDTYAYNVHIALSTDAGKSWRKSFIPHSDGTQTEHGFVSLQPWKNDQFFAVWLDGRNYAKNDNGDSQPPTNEMTLRAALIEQSGKISQEVVLDERVCDCCQTSAARTENGIVVLYRDRSSSEIRDISAVRYQNGKWSKPHPVHQDKWEIAGCPVNGPAVAASGKLVAAAWFTKTFDRPTVKAAFSTDEGITFGEPVTVDDGNPLGRVDVVLMGKNSAVVCWMEATEDGAEIRARKIIANASVEPAFVIAKTGAARNSGFPVMTRQNDRIIFAYTQPGDSSLIKTGIIEIADIAVIDN